MGGGGGEGSTIAQSNSVFLRAAGGGGGHAQSKSVFPRLAEAQIGPNRRSPSRQGGGGGVNHHFPNRDPQCNGNSVGVRGQRGRQEDSGTSKDVSRPGIEPGSQELASCAITARPPQHDTTGSRHRAFDVFQGPVTVLHGSVTFKLRCSPAFLSPPSCLLVCLSLLSLR